MGTAFLYGNGGSGGTGATLTVNAPAGATVTVSKDGKSKTKVADTAGVAVFKGLSSGEWTLSIMDGSQTASKVVTVTADYAVSITFFAATINVTYPAGSICTATDGVTTLTAPDTSGVWECVVPNVGTWTVSYTRNLYYDWCPVDITTSGQNENVTLILASYIFRAGYGYQKDITYNVSPGSVSVADDKITITGDQGFSFGMANAIDISQYSGMKMEYTASNVGDGGIYSGAMVLSYTKTPDSSQTGNTSIYPYKKGLTKTGTRTFIDLPFEASGNYYPFIAGVIVGEIYNWWLY